MFYVSTQCFKGCNKYARLMEFHNNAHNCVKARVKMYGFDLVSYVSECELQAKDRGNEQDMQGSTNTMHDSSQRNLQEKLDKQHRASLPGIFSILF